LSKGPNTKDDPSDDSSEARLRRRRKGAGLRVPSDNVPRRAGRDSGEVAAPAPEDPRLAVSVAYAFGSDAARPSSQGDSEGDGVNESWEVDRALMEPTDRDAMSESIDEEVEGDPDNDYTQVEEDDAPQARQAAPAAAPAAVDDGNSTLDFPLLEEEEIDPPAPARLSDESVDIAIDDEESGKQQPALTPAPPILPAAAASVEAAPASEPAKRPGRASTVALSDSDLEELGDDESVLAGVASARRAHRASRPIFPRPISAGGSNGVVRLEEAAARLEPGDSGAVVSDDVLARSAAAQSAADGGDFDDRTVELRDDEDIEPADDIAPVAAAPQPAPAQRAAPPPPAAAPHAAPPPPAPAPHAAPPPAPAPHAAPPPAPAPHAAPPPAPAPHAAPPPAPAPATPAEATQPGATPKPKPPPAPSGARAAAAAVAAAAADPSQARPRKRRGKPWFEEIFDEDYLRTLPFLTPQATQLEAQFVMDSLAVAPGTQVLDVGCGYGRHAMELAARGYHVVGLDSSLPLLLRGADEAQRRGLTINFVHGDMRDMAFDGQFDGAYCLFSTFGYFDDETNKKTAANICRALKPGARCVFELLNRDYMIADLPLRVWWEGDGCVVLEEVDFNYFSSRIVSNRSVVFDDGRQLEQEISIRSFGLHELGKLLHSVGFRVVEVSGSMATKGRFFGAHSRDIVVVAERRVEKPGAAPSGNGNGDV
jgi:SAM-dependent methyltransferase